MVLLIRALPSPPQTAWTAPGELTITYAGGVLHYQRPGLPATFLDCPSPCVLRSGGTDHLYTAQAGAAAWTQAKDGALSAPVLVPPETLWFRVILPIVVGPTAE